MKKKVSCNVKKKTVVSLNIRDSKLIKNDDKKIWKQKLIDSEF